VKPWAFKVTGVPDLKARDAGKNMARLTRP